MKERVHEIDSKAYIIMSEVADIFSNNMDKASGGTKFPPLALSIDFLMHHLAFSSHLLVRNK